MHGGGGGGPWLSKFSTYFSATSPSKTAELATVVVDEGSADDDGVRWRRLELRRKESLSRFELLLVNTTGSSGGGLIFTLACRERPDPNL